MISEVANESSLELSERERRKRNLVWFGVPECPATQVEERIAADTAFLIGISQRPFDLKLEVAACKRNCLKQAKNASTTNRPLLVTVKAASLSSRFSRQQESCVIQLSLRQSL